MDYLSLIDQNKDEMLKSLQELIAIKSVAGEREGEYPFGEGVQKAFEYMLTLGKKEGFRVVNVDNYGGHIEFGSGEEIVGVLGHLDVVPEGSGWDYEPYGGQIVDGRLYGRGAGDDKGPVMAAFYAMKALKDAGYVPGKRIRLILGLDEETNWDGMEKYFEKEKKPTLGFTPDADFPAIRGEKGILTFEIAKKLGKSMADGLELRSLTGGSAPNMVADYARAVLRDTTTYKKGAEPADRYAKVKEIISAYRHETGHKVNFKGMGKSLEITAAGIPAHGAAPYHGTNAVSIMMELLGRLNFVNEDVNDFIDFYNQHIGFDSFGERMGCDFCDEPSGKLTFNVGLAAIDQNTAELTINIRYPVTSSDDAVYAAMMPVINKYDMGLIKGSHQKPIYFPDGDPMIETLMDVYREFTGDVETAPLTIGGGTYARAAENVVAFGMGFPGDPELAHQKNEYVLIDNLLKSTKIYAEALARLAK